MAEKTLAEIAREAWLGGTGPTSANDWQAVADAVVAAHEARRWRSIDTAPKDGAILAWSPERSMVFQVVWRMENNDWSLIGRDGVSRMEYSHWTPIPAPPKEATMERSAERLRGSNDTLKQACDRHHEAYKVAERERVALVKRSHNQRVEIGRLIEQLTAATARAEAAESLVAGLRGALEEARKDNEELDGTDAAHPAWWRGNDAGVSQVCAKINAILDGADVFGTAAEPWESTRRRVAEVRKDSERLDWLEAHPRIIVAATGYRGAKDSWYWRDETDALATHETATLRAAIDSARGTK